MGTVRQKTVEAEMVPVGLVPVEDHSLEDPEAFDARQLVIVERSALRRMPYDPRIAAIIIARVAAGALLKKVCEDYGITFGTIHKWKRAGPHAKEFREALADAEALGAQYMVEEAVEKADEPMSFPVDAMKAKLQTDMRWKLAGKHAPERYGDKASETGGLDWGKVLDAVNAGKSLKTTSAVPGHAEPQEPKNLTEPQGNPQGGDPI